jgi:hypothetical protein
MISDPVTGRATKCGKLYLPESTLYHTSIRFYCCLLRSSQILHSCNVGSRRGTSRTLQC